MAQYIIPLSGGSETFSITLAGEERQLTVRWNDADQGGWMLDISEPDGGGDILCSLPLITGADILGPYEHLNLGGKLVVWSETSDSAPTEDNLGNAVKLHFITEDEG